MTLDVERRWAVVGDADGSRLRVLSRTPVLDVWTLEAAIVQMRGRGLPVDALVPTEAELRHAIRPRAPLII